MDIGLIFPNRRASDGGTEQISNGALLDWRRRLKGCMAGKSAIQLSPAAGADSTGNRRGALRRGFQEKLLNSLRVRPYRKPTQVCSSSRARRTSECTPRNSAKKRPYLRNKACPSQDGPQRKSPWRLFTKNTAPCELVRGCIGGDT